MLTLGFLSCFTALLLPGLLLAEVWLRPQPLVTRLLAALFLGAAWTALKVQALVALGLFSQSVLFVLCLLEAGVFVTLCLGRKTQAFLAEAKPSSGLRLLQGLGLGLWAFLVLRYLWQDPSASLLRFSTWSHWDAAVSWNRWALDWTQGRFAQSTWGYPQLLPCLWAYTYVFQGNSELEFFAKACADLLALAPALLVIDLLQRQKWLAALGLGLGLAYLTRLPVAMWAFQGLADSPLAGAWCGAFYLLYLGLEHPRFANLGLLTSGLALAGLSFSLKQQGLLLALGLPVLVAFHLPQRDTSTLRSLRWGFLLGVTAFLPWYLYYAWLQGRGSDVANVFTLLQTTAQSAGSQGLLGRLSHGLKLWTEGFGQDLALLVPGGVLLFSLGAGGFLRSATWLLVLPYGFIWALGFSYDIRNAYLLGPLLALVLALSLDRLSQRLPWLQRRGTKALGTQRPVSSLFFATALACSTLLGLPFGSSERLNSLQASQNLKKGDPDSNRLLLQLRDEGLLQEPLVTNYQILCHVPPLRSLKADMRYIQDPRWLEPLLKDGKHATYVLWLTQEQERKAVRPLLEKHLHFVAASSVVQVWSKTPLPNKTSSP